MKTKNHIFLSGALILMQVLNLSCASAQPAPLWRAHAHNDYEHERPLLDALEKGMGSIEVDIHLVDGELLVAHDLEDVDKTKTIESLYLVPLAAHIKENGGQIYSEPGSLVLLIDIKSEGEATYEVLRKVLVRYESILTRFEGNEVAEGPVTAIISGNRPLEMMLAEDVRWAAYDGRLADLNQDNPLPPSFIPLISSNWMDVARWFGQGEMPAEARKKLQELVKQAHAEGRKIRFWATSNNPKVWEELYAAGVDYLNADDLAGVQAFLLEKMEN